MGKDGEGFDYDDDGRFDYMDYDDDEDMDGECALMPNGQCLMAGSEDCDWDCPHSHGPFYAGSEAWDKRHDAGVPIDGCECDECNSARKRTLQEHSRSNVILQSNKGSLSD